MQNARKAVIFDLYGTLLDLEVDEDNPLFWEALAADSLVSERQVPGEVLKDLFKRRIQEASGHSAEGLMLAAVFSGVLEELGFIPTPEVIRLFAEKFRKHSIILLRKKNYTDDLLQAIRISGYKLGLLSNTEALLTAYDLKVTGLEDQIDAIVLSSNVGVKKPDKRIFEIILGRLNVDPENCAFVGDSFKDDITGALNAGIEPVFLTTSKIFQHVQSAENGGRIVRAGFQLQEIMEALRTIGFVI